jgi:hypothetical protein
MSSLKVLMARGTCASASSTFELLKASLKELHLCEVVVNGLIRWGNA